MHLVLVKREKDGTLDTISHESGHDNNIPIHGKNKSLDKEKNKSLDKFIQIILQCIE